MSSPRLLIALFVFFVLAQVICNFYEGNQMLYAINTDLEDASSHTYTTSTDTTGTSITWIDKTIDFCEKVFAFDYSMFYDTYTGYTQTTCVSADGAWQSDSSTCRFTNDFTIVRYVLLCFGIVMWIELALVLRRLILG